MLDQTAAPELPPRVTPPPAPLGLWRAFRTARRNLLELFPEAAYRDGLIEGGTVAPWKMVTDPDGLEHVFKTRAAIYPRSDTTRRMLRPVEGDSLFIAEGADWRWQRRAMAPGFAQRSLAALAPLMSASAEASAARLAAQDGAVVDLHDEMVAATFDIIQDTLLAGRARLDRREVAEAVTRFIETMGRISFLDIVNAPDWIPRPNRVFARGARRLDDLVDGIVKDRWRAGPQDPPDLLDLLMLSADPETGRRMTPVEVRNNLVAFIVAGHETTALALSWALWLVAYDPAVQARGRDEAQAALGDRPATAEALPRLGYVRQVVEEALRLYPPAGVMARTAKAEDALLGRPVAPGETILAPVWATHRHRALWEDPDAFDPDRFAPERAAGRHRYAFLPFGAGPRICIGAGFAMMEAQIILATLLARFRFSLAPGPAPRPEMLITLRPKGGVRLTVERL